MINLGLMRALAVASMFMVLTVAPAHAAGRTGAGPGQRPGVTPRWTAKQAPLPKDASTLNLVAPGVDLVSIACPSSRVCVAVGSYDTSAGYQAGLLLTDRSGSWTAAKAPMPRDYTARSKVSLTSVACLSAARCVAVGSYGSAKGIHGVLLSGLGRTWKAATAPLPRGALGSGQGVTLSTVTCPTRAVCVAAGSYDDAAGNPWPLLLTDTKGSWKPAKGSLPSDAAHGQFDPVQVLSVTCVSASECVAAGEYTNTQGNNAGLLVAGSKSSWRASTAPMPPNPYQVPSLGLTSVACVSATTCIAAGSYDDSAFRAEGVFVTGSKTTWKSAEAALPDDSPLALDTVLTITCRAKSVCVAVGFYYHSNDTEQGVLFTRSGRSWRLTKARLPRGYNGRTTRLLSAACPSAKTCVAVGDYSVGSGNSTVGEIQTGLGASWKFGPAPAPKNSAGPLVSVNSVACSSVTRCVAVGEYVDKQGFYEGLLLAGPG